eukprot:TRINITY_DN12659_c0_g1_i2.p1 TRINITY_DN12659_c0_g1~~TRINITY_DN12659_c0_g1_i2.p1  ORF type:complete len:206 (-),score=53.82 TRINITY_DN12659_c0_g1_i2:57-674(-)
MSQLRCRSSSVKRDQRSSSIADEDNPKVKVTTISRSRSNSPAPSKSKSKSKSRSRNRNRCRSKNNSSGRERSRSNSRRARGHKRPRSGGRSRLSRSRSRSPKRNGNDDGYRLHIADINEECKKRDLERIFQKYGPLKEIWLASYAPFYAFIVFRARLDAETAQARADGVSVGGRRIRVSMAKPRNTGHRNRFIADRRSGDRCTRY